ncbi:hypothetical protein [uncultured Roseobacter sp.]|uniref:hypothetical protein n=1 Tax=uncultured Roseobacter sp. TaxID=114847 RepID=UPI00262B26CD|nr:hypothetical protein [uncultured Roseobacter sp.]
MIQLEPSVTKPQQSLEESNLYVYDFERSDEKRGKPQKYSHRSTFTQLLTETEALPDSLKSTECLFLAAKLVEEAAYTLASEKPHGEVLQLMLMAARIEKEVERISGIR